MDLVLQLPLQVTLDTAGPSICSLSKIVLQSILCIMISGLLYLE